MQSRALAGANAPEVAVEVYLSAGLPAFNIVGLADTEVKESRDRVRSAILTSGFDFPARRIVVNLAPADLPKASGRYDLPIALGILAASGQIASQHLPEYEFAGELALSGTLRPVRGALAMALQVKAANRAFMLPLENAAEAALISGMQVLGAESLLQVCAHLNDIAPLAAVGPASQQAQADYADLSEVKGQLAARNALEVAAAGGHSLLLMGPPGCGKTMLASRIVGILPPMSEQEALESAAVQSLSRDGFSVAQWRVRAFRGPHHSSSVAALVGGGSDPEPGEVSMAHHGILFLDELPEFERRALESLREPLESGSVNIARVARRVSFPARFQLIAAMNPCPCGFSGHISGRCRCTPEQILRYRGKISGPLLDRLDMQVEMSSYSVVELLQSPAAESSACVQARVIEARRRQFDRQGKINRDLTGKELESCAAVGADSLLFLGQILERLLLSARSAHRILRVARTIADLAGSRKVLPPHITQAVQLRRQVFLGHAS